MDDASKALLAAILAFVIAILSIAPTYFKAKATKTEASANRDKADAQKELIEADGMRLVVQRAQDSESTQRKLADTERQYLELLINNFETKQKLKECLEDKSNGGKSERETSSGHSGGTVALGSGNPELGESPTGGLA